MNTAYDLIVFDWDGTLMDSEARIVDCLQAAFADIGRPVPSRAAAADVIGLGLDEAMSQLWPEAGAAERQLVAGHYRRHFLGRHPTPSALFPHARETLERLHAEGYLLAVATGKSRRGLEQSLDETGLRALFHATRCADETFSKPHPRMLRELMDELGATPERTLMIGDTEYDLLMAANAGADALAVCYGVHTPERLQALGPLACLSGLAVIPDWLGAAAPGATLTRAE